jgi:hypothetical protein
MTWPRIFFLLSERRESERGHDEVSGVVLCVVCGRGLVHPSVRHAQSLTSVVSRFLRCFPIASSPDNVDRSDGSLLNPSKLNSDFKQLKSGGVDGVMGDVWWGRMCDVRCPCSLVL